MMIGPVADSCALALGGAAGALLSSRLPERIRGTLPVIFGVITVSLGATFVGKAASLPVAVLALIVGTFVGEMLRLETVLEKIIGKVRAVYKKNDASNAAFVTNYVTLISAFCFGSMGLFGAFSEGLTGDPEILLTKAVLDLFTALVFGSAMGIAVSFIAVPQFVILAFIYLIAELAGGFVNETMLADFSGCGGVIFLATGLRICGIKTFPVINMLPALFFALLFSFLNGLLFPGG